MPRSGIQDARVRIVFRRIPYKAVCGKSSATASGARGNAALPAPPLCLRHPERLRLKPNIIPTATTYLGQRRSLGRERRIRSLSDAAALAAVHDRGALVIRRRDETPGWASRGGTP
jgi:hypothetical protein